MWFKLKKMNQREKGYYLDLSNSLRVHFYIVLINSDDQIFEKFSRKRTREIVHVQYLPADATTTGECFLKAVG